MKPYAFSAYATGNNSMMSEAGTRVCKLVMPFDVISHWVDMYCMQCIANVHTVCCAY